MKMEKEMKYEAPVVEILEMVVEKGYEDSDPFELDPPMTPGGAFD